MLQGRSNMTSEPAQRARDRVAFRRLLAFVAILLACLRPAAAETLYSDAALAADLPRYTERLTFLLEHGLRDVMTVEEKRGLADVVVDHPPRGRDLLTVEAASLGGMPVVTVPVSTLKFVEDLSVAYAWRYTYDLSLEPIDEYLAMLKHRPDAFAPGQADPLTALGVPGRIWESDPRVDDLSLRLRNGAWAFLLAHELGHVRLGHLGAPAAPAEIQRQEEAADAFAVELLARSDTIPMGMILWFQATAGYYPNRADFRSDAAYADWLAGQATHPVNGRRMRSLATALDRQAAETGDADRADVLRFIAARLATIGEIVEDPEMQRYLRRCAEARRPAERARRDDRPCA